MKEETLRAIEAFWKLELGMETSLTTTEASCTVQRLYNGVQMFRRKSGLVIAAPPAQRESIQKAIEGRSADELFSVEWLRQTLGQNAERILGPSEVWYADEKSFRSAGTNGARALSQADSHAYCLLQDSLDPRELEDSGFSAEAFPAFGVFSGARLCAAASYSIWKPSIAHIIVATHPEHRRRGFAKATIHALAKDALDRGLILQWRAVAWNVSSLALAQTLGFKHYCSTIFARIHH